MHRLNKTSHIIALLMKAKHSNFAVVEHEIIEQSKANEIVMRTARRRYV